MTLPVIFRNYNIWLRKRENCTCNNRLTYGRTTNLVDTWRMENYNSTNKWRCNKNDNIFTALVASTMKMNTRIAFSFQILFSFFDLKTIFVFFFSNLVGKVIVSGVCVYVCVFLWKFDERTCLHWKLHLQHTLYIHLVLAQIAINTSCFFLSFCCFVNLRSLSPAVLGQYYYYCIFHSDS